MRRTVPRITCEYRLPSSFPLAGTLRAVPPFVFLSEGDEEARPESRPASEIAEKPNFWTSQSCVLSSNWFSECEHPLIDKPMFVTKPDVHVPSAQLLGRRSNLYPSKKLHMLNNYLTLFVQCLSRLR